jgi:hypothetical protein
MFILAAGGLFVGGVATWSLRREFRGRVTKLSWAESLMLDPDRGRVPFSHPAHPVKSVALALFCLGGGAAILVFADLERLGRREGELVALGVLAFAVLLLAGGLALAGMAMNALYCRVVAARLPAASAPGADGAYRESAKKPVTVTVVYGDEPSSGPPEHREAQPRDAGSVWDDL